MGNSCWALAYGGIYPNNVPQVAFVGISFIGGCLKLGFVKCTPFIVLGIARSSSLSSSSSSTMSCSLSNLSLTSAPHHSVDVEKYQNASMIYLSCFQTQSVFL